MKTVAAAWLERIDEHKYTVDIRDAINKFIIDVVCVISFGESMAENKSKLSELKRMMKSLRVARSDLNSAVQQFIGPVKRARVCE